MIAYTEKMFHVSGTYRLEVGDVFYIGSSKSIGGRRSSHTCDLEKGVHWIPELQAAFNAGGEIRFFLLEEIPVKPSDEGNDHRLRLRTREQVLFDRLQGVSGFVNKSSFSGYNSGVSEMMRKNWADPEWRAATVAKFRAGHLEREVSTSTRKKMSMAKSGSGNPKARRVEIEFDGVVDEFVTATAAATHYGVSQQAMDLWLRGVVPWPGQGVRKPRHPHLIGMSGRYL